MAAEERRKNIRALRRVCCALLLTAVLFRLFDWWLYARSPEEMQAPDPSQSVQETEYPHLPYALPEREPWLFTPEEGLLAGVDNRCGAEYDPQALLMAPLELEVGTEPLVLIVHTHATEAYTPTAEHSYEASSPYRTADRNYNVVRVGKALADGLNARGIVTLHDTTLNDLPGYNGSYERMEQVISAYLTAYPSIKIVIDVHRDAVADGEGGELALRGDLGGEQAARLLLVMGTDCGALPHPNWHSNLSLALKLQVLGSRSAPGLYRDIALCASRYNEHLSPYSLLLEVGAAGNTLEEALRSAEFFAQELAGLLLSQKI